ncbi:MAG: RNA polymerase sigma factor (sigma-70 family) [Hyphomicrobiaceae bacterium]|jgi:RNA polymerase sigma factor (sigma-70 family)
MNAEPNFTETLGMARQGNQAALDRLFAQFYQLVQKRVHHQLATDFRQGRQWMASMLSTADVVQEVFLQVLQSMKGFQGGSEAEFTAYLTALTRNRILDSVRFHTALRRDRRRVSLDVTEPSDPRPQGIEPLITRDELARYTKVLASFDERDRLLLRSRLEGGEQPPSFAELAEELGFPSTGATRQAYFRARARLVLLLGNHEDK